MWTLFGTQATALAAGVVGKKALEGGFGVLSQLIAQRYRGDAELRRLDAALQHRLRMLALPIDLCAHHAARGNAALMEALEAALGVMREVSELAESLELQKVAAAQGEPAASPGVDAAALARRLQALIARLDSLLPYLNLAVSATALLGAPGGGAPGGAAAAPPPEAPSPSRLMQASWALRSCAQAGGGTVLEVPAGAWHELRQLAPRAPACWAEAFPLCSVRLVRVEDADVEDADAEEGHRGGAAPVEVWYNSAGSAGGAATPRTPPRPSARRRDAGRARAPRYQLHVRQSFADGRHHEEGGEAEGALTFDVSRRRGHANSAAQRVICCCYCCCCCCVI
jgi:hypothetical protein